MLKKLLVVIFGILVPLVMVIAVFFGYEYVYGGNVKMGDADAKVVFVYPDDTPVDVFNGLVADDLLKNPKSFKLVAQQKKWYTAKPGRYMITHGMSNNDLINMFRAGLQEPVQLTINSLKSVSDFAGNAAQQLMVDSVTIFEAFTDEAFLQQNELSYATVRSIILPNTYEVYWNTSAEGLRERLQYEYQAFWSDSRM